MDCASAAALLQGWDDILVLCHASPDGDTLGSAAALVRGLRALGKRARYACGDKPDEKFAYLFAGLGPEEFAPAHIMSVDVADASLLGGIQGEYGGRVELAIDHHGSHRHFARESWVDPSAAACCELVFLLLKEMGVAIGQAIASCLYTGISTDTGCFRYTNVAPRTHRIAAQLLELGANAGDINRAMFESKSRAQVEAERLVMEGLEFHCGGKCALVRVPWSVYQHSGAREGELEGIASLPRQIQGVLVGVTLKEKEDGTVKASIRSNPPASAGAICEGFGGGGHKYAGGCSFPGLTLEEAAQKLLPACREHLASVAG